jgi:ABC-type lipoprotein export system ATPase subunit
VIFAITGLCYRHSRARRDALRHVCVQIEEGQTTSLIGHSGSGKTTLLRLLGLLWEPPPLPGVMLFDRGDGAPVDYATLRSDHAEQSRLRRKAFGFVLQSPLLLPHLSCEENLALPLALRGIPKARWSALSEILLDMADADGELLALRKRRAREVSGGERQRFAVLRAMIHDPEVVFADEPVNNLDIRSAQRMLDVLTRWRRAELPEQAKQVRPRTLILVSHDVLTACRLADRILMLHQGELVYNKSLGPEDDRIALADELERWMRDHG